MDEQRTRLEVMVEDLEGHVKAVAESNQAVAAALAEVKADFTRRFDELDVKFVGMAIEMRDLKAEVGTLGGKVDTLGGKVDKLEGKVDKLEVFATNAAPRLERLEAFAIDAAPRLVRIEKHLALPALPPRRARAKLTPSKHHRRKPMKRN
jgi:outer membrane murein-binding lipoprotein Lpp